MFPIASTTSFRSNGRYDGLDFNPGRDVIEKAMQRRDQSWLMMPVVAS
jgi:hypothetical protein